MAFINIFCVVLCSLVITGAEVVGEKRMKSFPKQFEFGTSTSAYQIEGAWNVDGKGSSMWDHLVHNKPEAIADRHNGDIAANSYFNYKRDVQMLRELGVRNYRFSISWSRILPSGRIPDVNPRGIAYYNNLIDELLENGIIPFVTMYHWDLPQELSELGGWLNEDIALWFGDYAKVLYQHFGDRVKNWMTINEPFVHCYLGYGLSWHAPLHFSPGQGYYDCGRNILLANARAYRIYNDEFRAAQGGKVGFVVSMEWPIPESNSEDDAQAALDFRAFFIEHYLYPVFSKEGNYPKRMIDKIAAASATHGRSSRLTPFSDKEIEYIKGSADFLGLNHYASKIVYRNSSVNTMYTVPSLDDDTNLGSYQSPAWPACEFIHEYAPGFYNLLIYLRDNYNNIPIYITENGFPSDTGLNDDRRVHYFRSYLSALLDALADGVNVKGYFAWSLMDNFEWSFGYQIRFGLYEVDMKDPNRARTPRKSAFVLKEIFRSRVIDYNYDPDPYEYKVDGVTDGAAVLTTSVSVVIAVIILNSAGTLGLYL